MSPAVNGETIDEETETDIVKRKYYFESSKKEEGLMARFQMVT